MSTDTIERIEITVLARPMRKGMQLFLRGGDRQKVRTGSPPFTTVEELKAYDVEMEGKPIGDFHGIPVQSGDVVTIQWAARSARVLFQKQSAYKGGFKTREDAVDFILSCYDEDNAPKAKRYRFLIKKNRAGEYVAYFCFNGESIFWTEGFSSKASAKNAISAIVNAGKNDDFEIEDLAG